VIVENEGETSLGKERGEDFCRGEDFIFCEIFCAELKNSRATFSELGCKGRPIGGRGVRGIENGVEAGLM
jgi:hypothetical protein